VEIPLATLRYAFVRKPLLVGGRAMEYYGLRASGPDIDLVADREDVARLAARYPDRLKDLWGDLGVCPFHFEIWKSICLFDYDDLRPDAVDAGEVLVISLEKLLLLKAVAMRKEKYLADTRLVADRLLKDRSRSYQRVAAENAVLLQQLDGARYLEKTGPT
jgi:hypothetical protein